MRSKRVGHDWMCTRACKHTYVSVHIYVYMHLKIKITHTHKHTPIFFETVNSLSEMAWNWINLLDLKRASQMIWFMSALYYFINLVMFIEVLPGATKWICKVKLPKEKNWKRGLEHKPLAPYCSILSIISFGQLGSNYLQWMERSPPWATDCESLPLTTILRVGASSPV